MEFSFREMPVGGAALDLVGVPLPEDTISAAKDSDAVLLGAIGGYVFLYSPTNVGSTLFFFFVYVLVGKYNVGGVNSGTNGIRMKNI